MSSGSSFMPKERPCPEPGYRFDQVVPGSRLTMVRSAPRFEPTPSQVASGKQGARAAVVQCDCGAEFVVRLNNAHCGQPLSCSHCAHVACGRATQAARTPEQLREFTSAGARASMEVQWPDSHRLSRHELYSTWLGVVARCNKPHVPNYHRYGGRGIRVCDRWNPDVVGYDLAVTLFVADIEGYLGPRPEGMTLDRVCNAHDYRLDNVRWADDETQMANRGPALVGEVPPHGWCTD